MKKFLLIPLFFVVISCGDSLEKKANALINKEIQKQLILPGSYDPVETQIDSAFSPYHDPAFIEDVLYVYDKGPEGAELDSKIKRAKSTMAIFENLHDPFSRNKYKEAKEEYEKYQAQFDALTAAVQKRVESIAERAKEDQVFIGYKVKHRFRSKDNAGNVSLDEMMFLFDKDMSQIVAKWNKEEIDTYNEFWDMIKEKSQLAE